MKLSFMKTFCDLVETGSFSRAADSNDISQSAVSQQLARVEKQMSVQLINRGGGTISTTDAGQAYYEASKDILRRYETMIQSIRESCEKDEGIMRVGTVYSIGFYILEPLVRTLADPFPETELQLEYTSHSDIVEQVRSGAFTMGILSCGKVRKPLVSTHVADETLVAVCGKSYDIDNEETISVSALAALDLVGFSDELPLKEHIERLFRAAGTGMRVRMEFDNCELIKRALMLNKGVSILPESAVREEVDTGVLRSIRIEGPAPWTRPVCAVQKSRDAGGAVAEALIDAVSRVLCTSAE